MCLISCTHLVSVVVEVAIILPGDNYKGTELLAFLVHNVDEIGSTRQRRRITALPVVDGSTTSEISICPEGCDHGVTPYLVKRAGVVAVAVDNTAIGESDVAVAVHLLGRERERERERD